MKTYKANSDAADIYRSSAGMNITTMDSAAVLGNYAELMKNNIVVTTDLTLIEQTILPLSLPGDEGF